MPRDSFANCDVLLTVPKSRLTRRITLLGPAKMRDVNNALKFAMEIP
jgi:mRNA-degrading endonuclease toxin of MazEF toxin-antitoxin module